LIKLLHRLGLEYQQPDVVGPRLDEAKRYFDGLTLRKSDAYGFNSSFNAAIGQRSVPQYFGLRRFTSASTRGPWS
jgi:hypothetical protein